MRLGLVSAIVIVAHATSMSPSIAAGLGKWRSLYVADVDGGDLWDVQLEYGDPGGAPPTCLLMASLPTMLISFELFPDERIRFRIVPREQPAPAELGLSDEGPIEITLSYRSDPMGLVLGGRWSGVGTLSYFDLDVEIGMGEQWWGVIPTNAAYLPDFQVGLPNGSTMSIPTHGLGEAGQSFRVCGSILNSLASGDS